MSDSPSPPSDHSSSKSTPFLYYGLAIITVSALTLVIYNLIIVRFCTYTNLTRQPQTTIHNNPEPSSSRSFDSPNIRLLSSFKYKKEKETKTKTPSDCEGEYDECPICLSAFEEGEEVRQMPKCKHFFHAQCIDTWLCSHVNCPVCRASLESPIIPRYMATGQAVNSPGQLVFANMV